MDSTPEEKPALSNRMLVREVAVFQFKLIVDGLRDFFLVPVSLVAGLVSLLSGERGQPGPHFYQLLDVGKQSEDWIDLFGATRNLPPEAGGRVRFPDANMDDILDNIEAFVKDEEKRGGMTAQARQRFEKALRGFQDRRHSHSSGGTD